MLRTVYRNDCLAFFVLRDPRWGVGRLAGC